jgi:hypothetical protein
LGAQIDLAANARLDVDVDPAFEHGVLCDLGTVEMGGAPLAAADLGYQAPGHSILQLRNVGDRAARVLLLGGSPFAEQLVMWWNFVGRSHDGQLPPTVGGRRRALRRRPGIPGLNRATARSSTADRPTAALTAAGKNEDT